MKVTPAICIAEISQNRAAVMATVNEALKASPVQTAGAEGGESASAMAPPAGRGWYFNADDERYSLCETTDQSRYFVFFSCSIRDRLKKSFMQCQLN